MFKGNRKKLGDLLVESRIITAEQLNEALALQKQNGKRLGEILIGQKLVTQDQIIQVLEFQLGIPHVSLNRYDIDPEAVHRISENLAKRHELIPIDVKNNLLLVAMSDPLNLFAIDDVRIYSGMEVQPVIAASEEIRRAIEIFYGKQEAMKAAEEYKKEYGMGQPLEKSEENTEEMVGNAPIVKLVNTIIEQGIRTRASDIHIEPFEKMIRIRYRVDGSLVEVMRHDIRLLSAIISRIKVSGDMDIAEKRRPQEGRITMKVDGIEFDLRVSIMPTIFGEKAVFRIIDKRTLLKTKEELGFLPKDLEKFNDILKNPHGMILVTGPTGSGKTTTLYTTIQELNRENRNIVTIEDPVEASIEGVNQVQVNTRTGVDFATALRSILRQDPDIIMIGEIRDSETAEIAVKAAVTGHLVISTLHTNDAPATITRLRDMNIESFLIGTSVVGIISQRLVRKVCSKCGEAFKPAPEELEMLDPEVLETLDSEVLDGRNIPVLYRGHGCNACHHTGYQGRIGIYEIMPVTNELRRCINRGASSDELREAAIKEGMSSLKASCSRLVLEGITTLEELVRVTYSPD